MGRMLELPLSKANRLRLARAFHAVPRVDLSIDCVVEGQMGKAYVDDAERPTVYQIRTGPFAYFAGDPAGAPAQALLDALAPYTLLMPSAPGWVEAAQARHGAKLKPIDRYSLSAAALSAEHFRRLAAASTWPERVKPMDESFAAGLWGREHFIDLSDYDSPLDFVERGAGFYVAEEAEVLGAAWASLACSRGVEVSVFVEDAHQRRGMATALCSALGLWCLERGLEPHWDAANRESVALALKLGYDRPAGYQAHVLLA